jgi:transcriptional regulator with XRE-family HTH domain
MKVTIDGIEYAPVLPFYSGDNRTLPVLLADIRKVLGWTLEESAVRIGCSKSNVYEMERRCHKPSLEMAAKISRAYGVPIHILATAALNEES